MGEFSCDPIKYANAHGVFNNAVELLENSNEILSGITSYPTDSSYEAKASINRVIEQINDVILKTTEDLSTKINDTLDSLGQLDPTFFQKYSEQVCLNSDEGIVYNADTLSIIEEYATNQLAKYGDNVDVNSLSDSERREYEIGKLLLMNVESISISQRVIEKNEAKIEIKEKILAGEEINVEEYKDLINKNNTKDLSVEELLLYLDDSILVDEEARRENRIDYYDVKVDLVDLDLKNANLTETERNYLLDEKKEYIKQSELWVDSGVLIKNYRKEIATVLEEKNEKKNVFGLTNSSQINDYNRKSGTLPNVLSELDFVDKYYTNMLDKGITDLDFVDNICNYKMDKINAESVYYESTGDGLINEVNELIRTLDGVDIPELEDDASLEEIKKALIVVKDYENLTESQLNQINVYEKLYENDVEYYNILNKYADNKYERITEDLPIAEKIEKDAHKKEYVSNILSAYINGSESVEEQTVEQNVEEEKNQEKYIHYTSDKQKQLRAQVDYTFELANEDINNLDLLLNAQAQVQIAQVDAARTLVDYRTETAEQKEKLEKQLESISSLRRDYQSKYDSKYEYENMDWGEKAGANVEVFCASLVEGFLSVGEAVLDGSVMLTSGALLYTTPIGWAMLSDGESADKLKEYTQTFIEYEIAGSLYDEYVNARGLNTYVAYGNAHAAGNFVGTIAGYVVISLIPGGALVAGALAACAAAGDASQQAFKSGATYDEALGCSTVAGAAGFVAGAALDGIQGASAIYKCALKPGTKVLLGSAIAATEPVINSVAQYNIYAKDDVDEDGNKKYDSFGDYYEKSGGASATLTAAVIGGAAAGAGDALKSVSKGKKAATEVAEAITDTSVVATAVDNVGSKVSKIGSSVDNVKSKISSSVDNVKTKVVNGVDNIKTKITGKIDDGVGNIKSTTKNAVSKIKNTKIASSFDWNEGYFNIIDKFLGTNSAQSYRANKLNTALNRYADFESGKVNLSADELSKLELEIDVLQTKVEIDVLESRMSDVLKNKVDFAEVDTMSMQKRILDLQDHLDYISKNVDDVNIKSTILDEVQIGSTVTKIVDDINIKSNNIDDVIVKANSVDNYKFDNNTELQNITKLSDAGYTPYQIMEIYSQKITQCSDIFTKKNLENFAYEYLARKTNNPEAVASAFSKKLDEALQARGMTTVKIDENGISYNFVNDFNSANQAYDLAYIQKQIDSMPESLRKSIKEVNFYDCANPYDKYWHAQPDYQKNLKQGEYFVSAATGGEGVINLYANTYKNDFILYHEAAHNLDLKRIFSGSDEYAKAVEADLKVTGSKSVTSYGETNLCEDFAESLAVYFGTKFGQNIDYFPNRKDFLDKVFSGELTPNNLHTAYVADTVTGPRVLDESSFNSSSFFRKAGDADLDVGTIKSTETSKLKSTMGMRTTSKAFDDVSLKATETSTLKSTMGMRTTSKVVDDVSDISLKTNVADVKITTEKVNVADMDESTFLHKIASADNTAKDLSDIQKFISAKKVNRDITGQDFLYSSKSDNLTHYTLDEFKKAAEEILNVNNLDMTGGIKSSINDFDAVYDYDYRISLLNSESLKDVDILNFLELLKNKTNDLPYGIKVIPGEADAIVLYLKKENLYDMVSVLEDIEKASDIPSKFGNTKPFTVGLTNDSYYGVSMGATKDSIVNSTLSGDWVKRLQMGNTYTEYSGNLLDDTFNNLMLKYNDVSKITADEFYTEMHNIHNSKFGFDASENVPLWMNKEVYDIYKAKGIDFNN